MMPETHTPLVHFGHLVAMAFEANVAYSILLKLGKFSGETIDDWVSSEIDRVGLALAESKKFDKKRFVSDLKTLAIKHKARIAIVNMVTVPWAIAAIIAALLLQLYIPYHAHIDVPVWWEVLASLFLFGPIPIGLLINGLLHGLCWNDMRNNSREHDGAIKYLADEANEIVATAQRALKQPEAGTAAITPPTGSTAATTPST